MGHIQLTKENLRQDILDEIIKESRLIHCPNCGEELEKAECELKVGLPKKYEFDQRWKKCDQCHIIWFIELRKWENERGDGMVTDSGYSLDLRGYNNCYCRQSVFEYSELWLDEKHPRSSLPLDLDRKNQQERIQLNYEYPIDEMGITLMPKELPHWMILHEHFIRGKNLPISEYGAEIKKPTNVICPFCKKGVLQLVKVEPIHSGGPLSFSSRHHVGNNLEYNCSNEKCDAKFEGKSQWMHID